jgi:hypothetical protein
MDAFSQICSCGRTFSQVGAFKNHQNSCKKNKKRFSAVLAKAKEAVAARKRKASIPDTPLSPAGIVAEDGQISTSEVLINSLL